MSKSESANKGSNMYPMTEPESGSPPDYQPPCTVTQQPQLHPPYVQGGDISQPPMQYMQRGDTFQPPMQSMQSNTSQNIVVNVAAPTVTESKPRQWSTGLCDCFSDMGVCLCGFFCAPCQQCQIAVDMNESCCVPICLPGCYWLTVLRTKIRVQENIQGSVMNDLCTSCCCPVCAQCQLAREVNATRLQRP